MMRVKLTQGPTAGGNEVVVTGLNFGLADDKAKQQIIFDDWGGGFEASPLEPSEVIPGKKQVVFILPEWYVWNLPPSSVQFPCDRSADMQDCFPSLSLRYGTGKKVYIKLTPPHSGPAIKSVTPVIFDLAQRGDRRVHVGRSAHGVSRERCV